MRLPLRSLLFLSFALGSACEPEFPAIPDASDVSTAETTANDILTDNPPAVETGIDAAPDRTVAPPDATQDSTTDASFDAPADASTDQSEVSTGMDAVAELAMGPTCSRPEGTIIRGTPYRGRAAGGSHTSTASCTRSARSPYALLTAEVLNQQRVEFQVTSRTPGARLAVSILADCMDASSEQRCETDTDGDGVALASKILNPGNYTIIVERTDRDEPFDYEVVSRSFSRAGISNCRSGEGAGFLGPNTEGYNSDTREAVFPSRSCDVSDDGPVLYYETLLPPSTQARIVATPATGATWRARLRMTPSCADSVCQASEVSATPGAPVTIYFNNPTDRPRQQFFTFGTNSEREPGGPYNIRVITEPLGDTTTCLSGPLLAFNTPLTNQRTDGTGREAGYCEVRPPGGYRFYRVQVPPAQRITVTVTPRGTAWTPHLRQLDSCPAFRCAQTVQPTTPGTPVSITTDNPWGMQRELYFAVAASDGMPHDYDISATQVSPLAYTAQTVTAACDELFEESIIPGASSIDTVTRLQPIPLMFQFYGFFATHYAVSSNGNVQFFRNDMGVPNASPMNVPIPSRSGPNWFVAPFWDALSPILGRAQIRAGIVNGVDGRRYTIQWSSFGTATDPSSSTNFQVKLFETTNVVEFHWCALIGSRDTATVGGTSATIGMENFDGSDGIMASYNSWGIADTRSGIRFVPNR